MSATTSTQNLQGHLARQVGSFSTKDLIEDLIPSTKNLISKNKGVLAEDKFDGGEFLSKLDPKGIFCRTPASHRIWLRYFHPTQERSKSKGLLPPAGEYESLLTRGQQQGLTFDCFRMSTGTQSQLTQSSGDPQGYHLKHLFNNDLLWTWCTLSQRGDSKMMETPDLDEFTSISLKERRQRLSKTSLYLQKDFFLRRWNY